MLSRPLYMAAALCAVVLLSACQSDEDRLAGYLESAQALEAEGDLRRAMLQYRNALRIDVDNVDARAAIAAVLLKQGDLHQARSEYTTLAERFPDAPDWRRALGEIALVSGDWTSLRRHADALAASSPETPAARELALASAYRDAAIGGDPDTAAEIAAEAETRLADKPADALLLRIVMDHHLSSDTPETVLPILDRALDIEPRRAELQVTRLKVLSDTDDVSQLESRLLELATLFPDDPDIAGLLIARHMSQGRVAEAEAALRALADGAPHGEVALPTLLVTFLNSVHGPTAALAELQRLQADEQSAAARALYGAMIHAIQFDAGKTEAAIAATRDTLAEMEDGPEARLVRVMLAGMLDRAGDRPAARELVDEALGFDSGDVGALKLRATWAIERGDSLAATVDLRGAQARAPRDTEIMNLLAASHAIEDKPGLALEQLGRAAEVSGHGARESERYARALLTEGRTRVAERILEVALQAAPRDVALAALLAEVRLNRQDWDGVDAIDRHLARFGEGRAADIRLPLQIVARLAQGHEEAAFATLAPTLTSEAAEDAVARTVTALLAQGDNESALNVVNYARATRPGLIGFGLIAADVHISSGDFTAAETELLPLRDHPDMGVAAVQRLVRVYHTNGQVERATELLKDALSVHPDAEELHLMEANRLLNDGDKAGALAVYERLYQAFPDSPVVANNLAALLSTASSDQDDLARAARIAAPLRGSAVPAVVDTLGWIAYRQGDLDRALALLTRAARGLPSDAEVHLRLALVQAAAGDPSAARRTLTAVTALVDPGDPVLAKAEAALAELDG